jgi:PKD repeat protein
MKRTLLFLFSLLFMGSFVFAQKTYPTTSPTHKQPHTLTKRTTPFWSDDFSDANTWKITNGTGNNDNWVIGTEGPSGSYKIDKIQSTTASNGFALYDSDKMCSGNQDGYLTTKNPIDCSSHSNIVLSFESFYRKFKDNIFVEVSTDGTNWTSFEIHGDYGVNDIDPTNPTYESLFIGNIADGQSTVYIRFRFKSLSEGCDYSWQVDDVKLTELPKIELGVTCVDTPSIVVAGTHSVSYSVTNNGGDTIHNFNVQYIIDDTDTSIIDSIKNQSIAYGESLIFDHSALYNFSDAKDYKIKIIVTNVNSDSDEVAENNIDSTYIQVVKEFIPQKALHEVFTASTCPPCATANPVLDGVVYQHNEDKATLVKYQVNWPGNGDPYYNSETATRVSYYSVSGVPTFKVNGIITEDGASYTQEKLNSHTSNTTNSIISGTAEVTGTSISLNVNFTSKTQIKGTQLKARFAVVEIKTVDNKGTNGETEFHNVQMTMLPNANGYSLTAFDSANHVQNVQLNKDLKNTFIEGCTDLRLVAWIQNDSTKEVYQSEYIPITFDTASMETAYADFNADSIKGNSTVVFVNNSSNANSYKWNFGDGGTSTKTNPEHEYKSNNTFTVTLYAKNFCRDTAQKQVTITQYGVGINEVTKKEMTLYPNPTTGIVHITNAEHTDVIVYDINGKEIYHQNNVSSSLHNIDLSAYNEGQYIVKIISNDKVYKHNILLIK